MNTTVDFSDFYTKQQFDYINIYGPMHSGKTTLLNAAKHYVCTDDENEMKRNYHKHFLISLDFSDFIGRTFEDALSFMRMKMSELYLSMYEFVKNDVDYYCTLARYLDIIEGVFRNVG